MKYFSMFSGIGGFELGIQQAYDNLSTKQSGQERGMENLGQRLVADNSSQPSSNPTCIGYSEIDKYAIQIYNKHFNHTNYGNATAIDPNTLPDFDLICGGFPCQAFSIAGKRGGFDDTRGTLFFDIARIVRVKRPRLLFLENVKGLLSHDGGRTFDTIIRAIDELGYDIQWQVLNSKNFGVPQNRERVFIIGHLRGTSRPQVFPFGESSQNNLKYYWGVVSEREQWLEDGKHNSRNFNQGQQIYTTDGISQTLAGNAGGQGGKTGLYAIPLKFLDRNQKNYQGEYSFTVDTVNSGGIMQDYKIRRLTPTECERLQGYPDGWTMGVSDTQRYKTLGNSVTVNVIQAIAEKLL